MNQSVYGTQGEKSFRRTWDREEYAAKAIERRELEKQNAKERYEATRGIQKRETTPPDAGLKQARSTKIDFEEGLNKPVIVPAGAATGTQGKGVGFYCEPCNVTYKDNVTYVDHLNSRQHLRAIGQSSRVETATLEDVRQRLLYLTEKKRQGEKPKEYDIEKRLVERNRALEEERAARKARRKKKQAKISGDSVEEPHEMQAMMGFGGFGTTKSK